MENTFKTTKSGNILYINVARNKVTKSEILPLFTDGIKFVVFQSSSKLNTKEMIINDKKLLS